MHWSYIHFLLHYHKKTWINIAVISSTNPTEMSPCIRSLPNEAHAISSRKGTSCPMPGKVQAIPRRKGTSCLLPGKVQAIPRRKGISKSERSILLGQAISSRKAVNQWPWNQGNGEGHRTGSFGEAERGVNVCGLVPCLSFHGYGSHPDKTPRPFYELSTTSRYIPKSAHGCEATDTYS